VVLLLGSCGSPSIPQRDTGLPLPMERPEIRLKTKGVAQVVSETQVVKRFTGAVVDRFEKEHENNSTGAYSSVDYLFRFGEPGAIVSEEDAGAKNIELALGSLSIAVPYKQFPRLKIGTYYRVIEENLVTDSLGVPDLTLDIYAEDGDMVYQVKSVHQCHRSFPMEGLSVSSKDEVLYYTDHKVNDRCRVVRRHHMTLVAHEGIEGGSTSLRPGEFVRFIQGEHTYEFLSLDNSQALPGPCDDLIKDEMAHCTFILRRTD
jgi:hypothetical protein